MFPLVILEKAKQTENMHGQKLQKRDPKKQCQDVGQNKSSRQADIVSIDGDQPINMNVNPPVSGLYRTSKMRLLIRKYLESSFSIDDIECHK